MSTPNNSSLMTKWLLPLALFVASAVCFVGGFWSITTGRTVKSQLTWVAGLPQDVQIARKLRNGRPTQKRRIRFTVRGYTVSFYSDWDGFQELDDYLRLRKRLTLALAPDEFSLFKGDSTPLYELRVGGKTLVSYQDTLSRRAVLVWLFFGSGLVLLIGAFCALTLVDVFS